MKRFEGEPGYGLPTDAFMEIQHQGDSWWSWLNRNFSSLKSVGTIEWSQVNQILPNDLLLDGIDFHCSSMIKKVLSEEGVSQQIRKWLEGHQKSHPNSPLRVRVPNFFAENLFVSDRERIGGRSKTRSHC